MNRPLYFLLFFFSLFLLGLAPGEGSELLPATAAWQDGMEKVLASANDRELLAWLEESGAEKIVDYGAFSLWRTPAQPIRGFSVGPARGQPLDDRIYLRGVTIDPVQGPAGLNSMPPGGSTPGALRYQEPEEGFWMVQFLGPEHPDWRAALKAAGLEVVAYIPNHAYVVWGSRPASALEEVASATQAVQWTGAYEPLYRLAPALRDLAASSSAQAVTVQVFQQEHSQETIDILVGLALDVYHAPIPIGNTILLRILAPASALWEIAAMPGVVNVEPYRAPELLDEIQGQILAGNLVRQGAIMLPSQPGYLDWLKSKGFTENPQDYPLVDIVDDGLDSGYTDRVLHPDFYLLGDPNKTSRIVYMNNCTSDPSGNGIGGHGNLNAGIMAGYNDRHGFPYQDAQGYRLGLGISPFGPIASTKIFTNEERYSMVRCDGSFERMVFDAYQAGARITSNSWGRTVDDQNNNGRGYDAVAQTYDFLTRDASAEPGNQEMLHIFAAGNRGPDPGTIVTPGVAKNVLTVGAMENARDNGILDGCRVSEADSADNIASFSSRGPTLDGRAKPDIVAPGTHVQGPASLAPGYTGRSVCGREHTFGGPYYPANQNLYTWSSGTSHATPAIAGVAQLAWQYYGRVLRPGKTPSPAMVKAFILNTPRYLTGEGAGDALPSPAQGWGSADMGLMFNGAPRMLFDQEHILANTGAAFIVEGHTYSSFSPLHVTLVWTDAPGSPTADVALVNDLDLEVQIGDQVYRGNNFSREFSLPGGQADTRNNVESVFLPEGISGEFQVRVTARNISGDGVPGNANETDQDFALVIYNASTNGWMSHYLLPLIFR
jgi:hypothetical protein